MSSLGPSIAEAVSIVNQGHGFSMEICSSDVMKSMQVIDDTQDQIQSYATCPYCLVHAGFGLLLNTTLTFSAPQNHSLYPRLFYQSPKPLFAWIRIPVRAPPNRT